MPSSYFLISFLTVEDNLNLPLNCLTYSSSFLSLGPAPLKTLHCFPLSSSSISCSWSPPLSDFDSYEVECRRSDNGELSSALRLAGGVAGVTLERLEAHRKYTVTVRVSSAGHTSIPSTHCTTTMIDRKAPTHTLTHTVFK